MHKNWDAIAKVKVTISAYIITILLFSCFCLFVCLFLCVLLWQPKLVCW